MSTQILVPASLNIAEVPTTPNVEKPFVLTMPTFVRRTCVVIPSAIAMGTITHDCSKTSYRKSSLEEKFEMADLSGEDVRAVTVYLDPITTPGSNVNECSVAGWSEEHVFDTTLPYWQRDFSATCGKDVTLQLTLHSALWLSKHYEIGDVQLYGSIVLVHNIKDYTLFQNEASAIFEKIVAVIEARSDNVSLWETVTDDLTSLLLKVRLSRQGGIPGNAWRMAHPQMNVEKTYKADIKRFLMGGTLPRKASREYILWKYGPNNVTKAWDVLMQELLSFWSPSRVAMPQMEKVPGYEAASTFVGAVRKVPGTIDLVESVAKRLDSFMEGVSGLGQGLVVDGETSSMTAIFSELFCLMLDLVRECLQTHVLGLTTLAMRFCRLFHVDRLLSYVKESLLTIWNYFHIVETPVEQLDLTGVEREATPNGPESVLMAVIGMIGIGVCGKWFDSSKVKVVLESLRAVNVVVPALRNISTLLTMFAEILPACVASWFEVVCPEQLWLATVEKENVPGWVAEVDRICMDSNKLLLVHDAGLQAELRVLKERGDDIITKLSCIAKVAPGMYTRLSRKLDTVDEYVKHLAMATGVLDAKRPVPFCVYIFGKPGIGKSVATEAILEAIVPDTIPERVRAYSRVPGADYFDGYFCQWAVVMDDFAQAADGSDSLELIRMVNSTTYMPPMASLDNASIGVKATPFTSRALIITSNVGWPHSQMVQNQEAVWRRRHYMLEACAKPEYLTNDVLDATKIPSDVASRLDHLLWKKHNPLDPKGKPILMGTLEMLLDLRKCYKAHEERVGFLMGKSLFSPLMDTVRQLERNAVPQMEQNEQMERSEFMSCSSRRRRPDDDSEKLNWMTQVVPRVAFTGAFLAASLASMAYIKGNRDELSQCREEIFQYLLPLQEKVRKFRDDHPWIVACLTGAGLLSAILMGYSYLSGQKTEPQMANPSPGDLKNENVGTKFMKRQFQRKALAQGEFADEVLSNSCDLDKVADLLEDNMIHVRSYNPVDDSTFGMGAFVISGRTMILPRHFFFPLGAPMKNGTQMDILWRGNRTLFLFDERSLFVFPSTDSSGRLRDLAAYMLPATIPCFRSRLSLVAEECYLEKVHRIPGMLLSCRGAKFHTLSVPDIRVNHMTTKYSVGSARFATPTTLDYSAFTSAGDCGSLLIVADAKTQRKIVGLHIATCNGIGISELLTSAEIDLMRDANFLPPDRAAIVPQMCHNTEMGAFHPMGTFTHLGRVSRNHAVRLSDTTHILPSAIHDLVEKHTTEPSVLHPHDLRLDAEHYGMSVARVACEKYACPSGPFDQYVLDEVVDFYADMFNTPQTPVPRRILCLDEAINGIDGIKYMDGMCMASSAGYAWKKIGHPGKRHLFNQLLNGKYEISDSRLLNALNLREEKAKIGERVESIWTSSLKDERLAIEKILIGKTRDFSIPPVDYTLLVRKYFLSFCGHFYSLNKASFSAVGCDPESSDWNVYANQLLKCSPIMFDADFKKFDGVLSSEIAMRILGIINSFYDDGPENAEVRRILFEEMLHTVNICGDCVFIKHGGMPSGHPCTVVVNTLVGLFYMLYCYLVLAPPGLDNNDAFRRSVYMKVYGDDNIAAVTEQVFAFFNLRSIAAVLAESGVTVLPASKREEDFDKHSDISSITFLKRNFAIVDTIHPSFYIAQMSQKTIYELLNWVHDSADVLDMTMVNCDTALRFAMFHGRLYFETLRKRILEAFKRRSCGSVVLPSFSQLRRIFLLTHFSVSVPKEVLSEDDMFEEDTRCAIPQGSTDGIGSTMTEPTLKEFSGISMMTQAPIRLTNSHVEKIENPPSEVVSVQESSWTLKELAAKEIYLQTVSWSTANTVQTPLFSLGVPNMALMGASPMLAMLRNFTYYRGTWVFTFKLNGTRFHQGMLIAYFTPLVKLAPSIDEFVHMCVMQHVILNANTSGIVEVRIPFIHQNSYCKTLPALYSEMLGLLRVAPLNNLQYCTGASTSLSLSISYRLEDLEVYLPLPVSPPSPTEREGVPQSSEPIPLTGDELTSKVPALGPEFNFSRLNLDGEEKYTSFRDILKRKMPAFRTKLELDENPGMENYPSLRFLPVCALWSRAYPMNFFSDVLNMYALHRGSLRLTFDFTLVGKDAAKDNVTYFAAFMPLAPPASDADGPSSQPAAGNLVGAKLMPNFTYYHAGTTPISEVNLRCGTRGPVAYTNSAVPTLTIEVPFTCLRTSTVMYAFQTSTIASQNDSENPGTVYFGVNGLKDQQTVDVRVWVSLGDSYRAGVLHAIPKLYRNTFKFDATMLSTGIDTDTSLAREREANPQGNQVSVWHNKVVNSFGNVGAATLPTNITGDKFDMNQKGEVTAMMDKPSWTLNGTPMIPQMYPFFAHCQNIEPLNIMALYPSTQVTAEPDTFGTNEDEMLISNFTKRMALTRLLVWDTSYTSGTTIGTEIVGVSTGFANDIGTVVSVAPIDLAGTMFAKWNGSIRYRMQIVANGFHTGRLFVSLVYTDTWPDAHDNSLTLESASRQYGVMIDLGESAHDFVFDVPYRAPCPWSPVNDKYGHGTTPRLGNACLRFYVVNKLACPMGSPTNIGINLWKGAGEDFQLSLLGGKNDACSWQYYDDPTTPLAVQTTVPPKHVDINDLFVHDTTTVPTEVTEVEHGIFVKRKPTTMGYFGNAFTK